MDFLINWIPGLWSVQASWGQAWLVGLLVIFCLGVVFAGVVYEMFGEDESERAFICGGLLAAVAVVAAFWPMFLIALPFIVVVASLFYGGVYLAQSLEEAARVRALERRDD